MGKLRRALGLMSGTSMDGIDVALLATDGNRELEGIDFLQLDEDGRVAELTVFMRPFSALTASEQEELGRLCKKLGLHVADSTKVEPEG